MTALWTAHDLQSATGGTMPRPFGAAGISIDTRTLVPGDLFIALVAEHDGHGHLQAALDRGAAGLLVHDAGRAPAGAPVLVVPDTLTALTDLGRHARARFAGQAVAITGSVGKTTTKEMLRLALGAYAPAHAAHASYNNHWGVPLTLARIPADARYAVIEIGMNNPGEILPLARLARPDVAVITNIHAAHIGHLGSLDAIAREKGCILQALPPGGPAVVPAGFGYVPDGVRVVLPAEAVALRLQAPGAHMRANALTVLAVIEALGLPPGPALAALAGFTPGPGRGQQRRLPHGVTLLDESYNASAASVRAALQVLGTMPGRHLAVLGDMLELGDHARPEHESLAPDVAAHADLLYACGPQMKALFDLVPATLRAAHAPDSAALAPIVTAAVRPGDSVLVKGSLGSRMAGVVRALEGAG